MNQDQALREAVARVIELGARLGRGEVIGGTPYAVSCWHAIQTIEAALSNPLGGGGLGSSVAESTDAPCSASSAAAEDGQRKSEGWLDGRRFSQAAGQRVRHIKRGTTYTLPFGLAEALLQTSGPITDDAVLTIYIGEDGMIFARPTHEFHDGRFVPVPEAGAA